MPRMKFLLIVLAIYWGLVHVALLQETCAAQTIEALEIAEEVCHDLARNTACYGNPAVLATLRPTATTSVFENSGDVVPLDLIERLSMTNQAEAWGIVLLQAQAELPDILIGQNVTFVLFGTVDFANITEPPSDETILPIQAFYLATGIGDRPCSEAPDSGILVQTAAGSGVIHFTVNGVEIELGSTAYLQAADNNLHIALLEGSARVTAAQITRVVTAGYRLQVPLEEDGQNPAAAPTEPQPYDTETLTTLPLALLPTAIALPIAGGIDVQAAYTSDFHYTLIADCADWDIQEQYDYTEVGMNFEAAGAVLNLGAFVYQRASAGVYTYQETYGTSDNQSIWNYTIHFSGGDSFEGELVATWNFSTCSPRWEIRGTYSQIRR